MGLGYVGAVSAACLAIEGHEVVGVDPNASKVAAINAGRSPIVEPGLGELLSTAAKSGALRATTDPRDAVAATDLSLICVGTPGLPNGDLNVEYLDVVSHQIGDAVARTKRPHTVVVRSTVLPGTMRGTIIPGLARGLGSSIEGRIGVAVNPEFLREGTAIQDYMRPAKTVIGSDDAKTSAIVRSIYEKISGLVFETSIESAEMAKYVDNSWHALKVTFANEMGWLCGRLGVDCGAVMEMFLADTKLNISTSYLRPGFAFGGSCLPKDVRALSQRAKSLDLLLPVLENILASNQAQIERALELVIKTKARRLTLVGLTFKPDTDDVRESPYVELAERLTGKGFDLRIFDPHVSLPDLVGSNKEFARRTIPHFVETADRFTRGRRQACRNHHRLAHHATVARAAENAAGRSDAH